MKKRHTHEKQLHGKISFRNDKLNLGVVSLSFLTLVVFCVLGLTYVIQANDIANKGYAINQAEEKIQNLKEKNEILRTEIAKKQSIQNLHSSRGSLNLHDVISTEVKYVEVIDNALVIKD